MAIISMKQLLEAGVHFGHQTRRWNPKMAPYIFTERNGIYIIDLQKTVKKVDEAYNFIREVAASGESILFVGTKKQAQEAMKEEATRCNMFYVNERWQMSSCCPANLLFVPSFRHGTVNSAAEKSVLMFPWL